MKTLLVNGSPHRKGCAATALSIVAEELRAAGIECEDFWIGNRAINGCIGCRRCTETGHCIFHDVVDEFLAQAKEADAFVFGSPVYFGDMASGMKSFMDRAFYSCKLDDPLRFKPAAMVVSSRRAGSTSALAAMDSYAQLRDMTLVTSFYWPEVHGYTPEDVYADKEGVSIMRELGRNLAWQLQMEEAARAAGLTRPEPAERAYTSFMG